MRLAISLLLLCAALGCSTTRSPVSHFVASSQDLSLYRTWDWDDPHGPADPPLDGQIRDAVARELAARGYQLADGHWPELRVSYRLALHREVELYIDEPSTQFISSFHSAGAYEIGTSEQRVRVYETGTLSLRVDRPAEARSAWWALQSTRVRSSFAREVPRAIAAMFETFPAISQPSVPTRTTEKDGPMEQLASAP